MLFLALARQDRINYRLIVVYNPISKTQKYIQVEKTNLFSPVWSPDGQFIFAHDTQNLYQWDREGNLKETLNLEKEFGSFLYSAYSTFRKNPEGDIWLFDASEETESDGRIVQRNSLYAFNQRSGERLKLSPDLFNVNGYCWGPDFSEIYISGQENGNTGMGWKNSNIYRINPDGTGFFLWKENACQPTFTNHLSAKNKTE